IAGIIMSALGASDAAAGVVEFAAAKNICGVVPSQGSSCVNTYRIIGVTGMVVGGVLVAVGLPLAIVGGSKVPAGQGAPPPPTLSLRVGPTSTGLSLAF